MFTNVKTLDAEPIENSERLAGRVLRAENQTLSSALLRINVGVRRTLYHSASPTPSRPSMAVGDFSHRDLQSLQTLRARASPELHTSAHGYTAACYINTQFAVT